MCLAAQLALGTPPVWQVQPSSYTYTMNITAQLNMDCTDLNDTANMLGAFVSGNCRGVVHSAVPVQGRYLAFLTIYSNSYTGDTISFRIYNAQTDSVYAVSYQAVFTDGVSFGTPAAPLSMATNALPTDITLSKNTVIENRLQAFVGKLSTEDIDHMQHTYQLVSGSGDTNNTDFMISNDSLFTSKPLSYAFKNKRSLRISTSDGMCTYEKVFSISIKDTNNAPTLISLSQDTITENNSFQAMVGQLQTIDFDSVDTHSYQLVSGSGDDDNSLFEINNDLLLIGTVANFEDKSQYSILVESDDGDGGNLVQQLLISVKDINEKPELKDTTLVIPENFKLDKDFSSLSFKDQDLLDTHTFAILNTSPFKIVASLLQLKEKLDYEKRDQYSLSIAVTDAGGLSDTANIIIQVSDAIEDDLPASKVITPNGDGFNDFFTIQNVDLYTNYSLRIYNSSGLLIYERSSNYDNSWDGTYHGQILESDVYYYLLENNADSQQYFKGTISIVK